MNTPVITALLLLGAFTSICLAILVIGYFKWSRSQEPREAPRGYPHTDDDLFIMVPRRVVGDGEAGEPLTDDLQELLRALAEAGWWPVDLGTEHEHHVQLWLYQSEDAVERCEHFIIEGGRV